MIVLQSCASTGKMKASSPEGGFHHGEVLLGWQRSSQDALRFTFATLGKPIVRISSINSMRGAASYGDLTPHERHAQAAMILACVERNVDSTEMAYLRSYYGRELCNGEYAKVVADVLVRAVVGSLGTGLHPRRGIQKLIFAYFGQDIPISTIRRDLQCSLDNAIKKRNIVYDLLGNLGARADNDAELALYNSGMIEI